MLEKMKEIIAEQLGVEEDEITPDTSFKEDLGADSLDLFELTMALEEEYDTEIPAEELEDIETVGDVIEYLREKGIDEQAVDNKRTDPDKQDSDEQVLRNGRVLSTFFHVRIVVNLTKVRHSQVSYKKLLEI